MRINRIILIPQHYVRLRAGIQYDSCTTAIVFNDVRIFLLSFPFCEIAKLWFFTLLLIQYT